MAYLDNSATTAVCAAARDKAIDVMTTTYGNPSSLHTMGLLAEREMTDARRAVAAFLGLDDHGADLSCITFTSGGTEANNLAIFGAAAAKKRQGNHIVTTAFEHPSVLEAMKQLEKDGFELTVVFPDEQGDITAKAIADACRKDTVLVSVMLVNNELGTLLPIREAVPLIRTKSPQALIHCDAVQAAGKLPLKVRTLGIDLLSVSGHKLHAPKGVGALYVKNGVRIVPRVYGGGQERGLRSGTESVPLVAAFGKAVRSLAPIPAQHSLYNALRSQLLDGLADFDNVIVHTPKNAVPYITHISVCGFKSETLVHFLATHNVFVSAGSACAKGHESHVLKAMGLSADEIDSSLRISLCADNTPEDIQAFLIALKEAVASLASVKR